MPGAYQFNDPLFFEPLVSCFPYRQEAPAPEFVSLRQNKTAALVRFLFLVHDLPGDRKTFLENLAHNSVLPLCDCRTREPVSGLGLRQASVKEKANLYKSKSASS